MNSSSSSSPYKVQLLDQNFLLHPLKAMYWEEKSILFLSDLHLGKARHFSKSGIPIPSNVGVQNLKNLEIVIDYFQAPKVCFLGDLFHSSYNKSWEDFAALVAYYPEVQFDLVQGNHDILKKNFYLETGLHIYDERVIGPFLFTHEPIEQPPLHYYNISGHVHPSVLLSGPGKQRLKLPCFYFGRQQAILPAFGLFTGTYNIKPRKGERVFVISEERVFPIE